MGSHGASLRSHWIPVTFFILATLSISMLIMTDQVNKTQYADFILDDAVTTMQSNVANFHLWLEEAIFGDEEVDMNEVWAGIDTAIDLSNTVLNGGEFENHPDLKPLEDLTLRGQAEELRSLLTELKTIALQRYVDPKAAGIGSALDRQFDGVYKKIQGKLKAFEKIIDKKESRNRIRSRRLFWGMLLAWVSIAMGAAARLWSRELQSQDASFASRTTNPAIDKETELWNPRSLHKQMRIPPLLLFVMSGATIFLVEVVVMLFLRVLSIDSRVLEALVDAVSLILLLLPALYFLWFRPMKNHMVQLVNKDRQLQIEVSEHRSAEQALQQSEKHLRYLSSQLLTAQETERKRVAREIHDEVGAALAFLKIRMGLIGKQLKKDQDSLRAECNQNLQYIDQVIENVSRLSRDLSPSILDDLGLSSALRYLASNFMKHYHVKVTLNITGIDHLLSRHEQTVLYRIFQEAFNNIGKHAQAQSVSVTTERRNGEMSFVVEDDGKGFDLDQAAAKDPAARGLGLMTMSERARMLRGILEIRSQEGKGTLIRLTIPVEDKEVD